MNSLSCLSSDEQQINPVLLIYFFVSNSVRMMLTIRAFTNCHNQAKSDETKAHRTFNIYMRVRTHAHTPTRVNTSPVPHKTASSQFSASLTNLLRINHEAQRCSEVTMFSLICTSFSLGQQSETTCLLY